MQAKQCYRVVIIGSGFGGQCAAMRLQEQGITDIRILERRDFMGGTWCQNSYPGAAVDVQSPLYSIASEPYAWSQMFAERDELQQYTNSVIDKHGLREKTTLNANVKQVEWDDSRKRWLVDTDAAGTFEAQILINASGPLSTPVIPAFPGRDTFKGVSFHTNGWDHSYDYSAKRVAIVGSGASAAQVIPAIAGKVKQLHVFQRSPHWVLPRKDRKFTNLQRKLLTIRPLYKALRWFIYWSLETRVIGFKYSKLLLNILAKRPALKHLKKQVPDPQLRKQLTPDFTIGCKRIILSSTLYPALCQENVSVHDKNDGIAEINERGILTAQGQQLDVDLIIWSTGYDATDGVISYPVRGKNDKLLSDVWREFPRAYLGTAIPDFPNLFVVTGPNTGIGHTSAIFIIESQMKYITDSIAHLDKTAKQAIEVSEQAEAEYTDMVHSEMEKTVWKSGGCTSWYQSKSGHVIAMFPGFSFTYRRLASRFKPKHHQLS
ncbi:Baeyer-Villiger monooxygenase [Zhongshania aliphaticivorans]|uniref:Baeyer-Villiger monooxygenase n=1 Tax=Zhongshania aliphaticivorans TaxID=1470434 RepID=A0A5S9PZF2_9GAMM|nr:NAD(P)/FAD-dependent oxidoreductase [Zhongshania aliphaticivorans]CAA0110119.1 Baeyer-Villiger monooxygenase [Zhongshania aliphaticivorans]CAA0118005.1 Baeyer-Villiger monooxygenase [Zhongshania aliphaticivorans]CAA0121895.1 Baeyer-Villiger monooxygenase [Zhongshania aliphaticivorans]